MVGLGEPQPEVDQTLGIAGQGDSTVRSAFARPGGTARCRESGANRQGHPEAITGISAGLVEVAAIAAQGCRVASWTKSTPAE